MQGDRAGREPPTDLPERELWRRSVATDTVEDEAERCLDLAGFADGLLDPYERERVAERLARDPDAAADVAAARARARGAVYVRPPEAVVARARALVGGDAGPGADPGADNVLPFRPRRGGLGMARWAAQWGSVAAAVVVAGWLGFTLGMDTSRAFGPGRAGDDVLDELIDVSAGLMRDLTDGSRT
jgi:anti-sigma factor RsiW